MRQLREHLRDSRGEKFSGTDRELALLLDAVEPWGSDLMAKRRISVRLRVHGQPSQRRRLVPVVVGIALFGAASASAAVLKREEIVETLRDWLGKQPAAQPAVALQRAPARVAAPAPKASAPAAPDADEPAAESVHPGESRKSAEPGKTSRTPKRSQAPVAKGEDPSQVAAAIRALRSDNNPAKAEKLLNQYLNANPNGALSEDALALAIEAATARQDARAAEYARRYLARFPKGRYRELAERALNR